MRIYHANQRHVCLVSVLWCCSYLKGSRSLPMSNGFGSVGAIWVVSGLGAIMVLLHIPRPHALTLSMVRVMCMLVVVNMSRLSLGSQPCLVFSLATGHRGKMARHLGRGKAVGWPRLGWLTARRLHDTLYMLIQDALRVLLMRIAQPQATVGRIWVACRVVLHMHSRGQPVASHRWRRGHICVISFFFLQGHPTHFADDFQTSGSFKGNGLMNFTDLDILR